MTDIGHDMEAAQRVRFEHMVALVRELDRATAMGEAAPVEVLAQLDALLLEAAIEFGDLVDGLVAGSELKHPVGIVH